MSKEIEFKKHKVLIDGKSSILLSAEMHYFRIDPAQWHDRIVKLKNAGANTISSYFPWAFHQRGEKFAPDFIGRTHPRTDIKKFIKLVRDEGLFMVVKPGPYQYAELYHAGIPDWLVKNHPEILAKDVDGSILDPDSVSYIHPTFLKFAEKWYKAFCKVIKPFLVTNGGNIVMMQLDNELCGMHTWEGHFDFTPEAIGIGKKGGHITRYFQKRFGTVERLNELCNKNYNSFTELEFPRKNPTSLAEFYYNMVWEDWYKEEMKIYAQTLKGYAEKSGIDINFSINIACTRDIFYFENIIKDMPFPEITPGLDAYYGLGLGGHAHPDIEMVVKNCLLGPSILREISEAPTSVYEFQVGSLSDIPRIYARDLEYNFMNMLAYGGIQAFIMFLSAAGYNPFKLGSISHHINYQAPIHSDGSLDPKYYAIQRAAQFMRDTAGNMANEMTRATDLSIGFDFEYGSGSYNFNGKGAGLFFDVPQAYADYYVKGLCIAAYLADYAWDVRDLGNLAKKPLDVGKPLWVMSLDFMRKETQEALLDYVKKGGNLILSGTLPEYDNDFTPCSILQDALVRKVERRNIKGPLVETFSTSKVVESKQDYVNAANEITFLEPKSKRAKKLFREARTGKCTGFTVKIGKGKITVLGFAWTHYVDEHFMLLDGILKQAGVAKSSWSSNPDIKTSLWYDDRKAVLFASNPYMEDYKSTLFYNAGCFRGSIGPVKIPAMSVVPYEIKL